MLTRMRRRCADLAGAYLKSAWNCVDLAVRYLLPALRNQAHATAILRQAMLPRGCFISVQVCAGMRTRTRRPADVVVTVCFCQVLALSLLVSYPVCLRACYAIPCTDKAHLAVFVAQAKHCRVLTQSTQYAVCLCAYYAMPGADITYTVC